MKKVRYNKFRHLKIFISLLLIGVSKFAYPAIWCAYHPILGLGCGYSEQSCSDLGGEEGFSNQGNYYLLCISFSNEEVSNTSNMLFVDQTNQAVLEVGGKRINVVSDKENIFLKKLFKEYDPKQSAEVKKQISDFDRIDDGIVSEPRLDKIAKKFNAKIVRVDKLPEADYCPRCEEENANALDEKYKNLQASIIQLNFAKSSYAVQKTQAKVLGAYASYLQRAINQEGIPAGELKIGGNDPIAGIDIIIKKDPTSRPIPNPENDPTINNVNRLEKAYLAFKLKEVKENYEKEGAGKMTYEEYLAQEIAQAEKEKSALPAADNYVSSDKNPTTTKDKQVAKKTNKAKDKPTAKSSKVAGSAIDGFTPDVPKYKRATLYSGSSMPVGGYGYIAKTGVDIGFAYDIPIHRFWAIGFDINQQWNKFDAPFDLVGIPSVLNPIYRVSTTGGNGSIKNTTFSVGPTWNYNISPKAYFEIYSKVGISTIGNVNGRITFDTIGRNGNPDEINEVFIMKASKKTALGVTSGIRYGYQVSPKLSVFINPQYVYSKTSIDYTFADNFRSSYSYVGNPLGYFHHDLTFTTKTINPSHFNVNIGVTYQVGKKKEQKNVDGKKPIEKESAQRTIIPIYPPNNANFSEKNYDKFTWNVIGEKYLSPQYKIEVTSVKNPSEKYVGYSSSPSISTKEVFKESRLKGHYIWQVTEMGSGLTSNSMMLKTVPTGLNVQLQNISCQSPAFDQNGNVLYTGEVVLTNSSGSDITIANNPWLMNNDPASEAQFIGCYDGVGWLLPYTTPFVISPGNSVTQCIRFSRPFGETSTYISVDYSNEGLPITTEYASDSLPNCVCDMCDDWKYDFSNKQVTQVNSTWGNMAINQAISIAGAQPIQKVTAEVVFVKNNIRNPECYTCTKEDDRMGLFARRANSGKITTNPTNWQNDGLGELNDENDDLYGNQYTWCASDAEGVDFNNPNNIKLSLNLPEISSLECCKSSYEICIRYTFTDIDCKTCSEVVCYSFEPSAASGDIIIEEQDDERKKK